MRHRADSKGKYVYGEPCWPLVLRVRVSSHSIVPAAFGNSRSAVDLILVVNSTRIVQPQ